MSTLTGDSCFFTREFELDCCEIPLTLYQKEVGDVSCVVWDASLVLAKYLEVICSKEASKDWLQGKNVLELGAGVGCVGLTAACFGAQVVMTDLPEVICLLQKNIDSNCELFRARGGTARAKALEWGKTASLQDEDKPDVLLLADCIYYNESIAPLITTMCALTHENTEVLLCQEERISAKQVQVWKDFQKLLERHFEVSRISEEEQHNLFFSSDICVMKLKRRKSSMANN